MTATLYDGNLANLLPGVHLLSSVGHTPGSQSVVVDTQEGRVIVCGICCDEGNFNPPEELKSTWPEVLVPGIHTSSQDAYENLLQIKRKAEYIITLHDKDSYSRGACPGPAWPRYK